MRKNTAKQAAELLALFVVALLVIGGYFVQVVKPNEQRVHEIEQCVVENWRAYEGARSEIPPIWLESEWRSECVERFEREQGAS